MIVVRFCDFFLYIFIAVSIYFGHKQSFKCGMYRWRGHCHIWNMAQNSRELELRNIHFVHSKFISCTDSFWNFAQNVWLSFCVSNFKMIIKLQWSWTDGILRGSTFWGFGQTSNIAIDLSSVPCCEFYIILNALITAVTLCTFLLLCFFHILILIALWNISVSNSFGCCDYWSSC